MDWAGLASSARTQAQALWETAQLSWAEFAAVASPHVEWTLAALSNPWARASGLAIIVYFTIRVIASVYSGDRQNSELGPIGIRPHTAQRLDRKTVVLPRKLMPMNMDGVSATLKVFYAYTDSRGKPCKQIIHTIQHSRLAISPANLPNVRSTVYGHEIPDVATNDVCFPPIEMERTPSEMPATPDRAQDYAVLHKIVENWREDDDAPLISLHSEQCEEVADLRRQFIVSAARKVASAREGSVLHRFLNRSAAKKRPNVVGSYYIKFEFSHDPLFVLTRHPDRELKMTAWLTVLTSAFSLIMDAWPELPPSADAAREAPARESPTRPPRIARAQ